MLVLLLGSGVLPVALVSTSALLLLSPYSILSLLPRLLPFAPMLLRVVPYAPVLLLYLRLLPGVPTLLLSLRLLPGAPILLQSLR